MKKRILSLVMALVLVIGLLPMSALAAGSSSENWTISVEKYDADGNGAYLLEPTVVNYDFYEIWVPGILNYYWENNYSKVEYDSHRNEYYITKIEDSSQKDGWLDNGDLGENSHWKIVWNDTVLADKPSGCYASRGAVIRYIFSVNGDAAEAGVKKDELLQAMADADDKTSVAYSNACEVALDPDATEAEVAAALAALNAEKPTVDGISISPDSLNLKEGQTATVTATLTPEGAEGSVIWSVNDERIATVDQSGKVTANNAGETTLTATVDGTEISATAAITVSKETRYVYFDYTDETIPDQQMAEDGSFTLSSLDQGYFRVAGTDATPWWENEEKIDAGNGSVAFHWYVNRETGEWQPSGQQPTKPIVVTAGDFTKSFTINYVASSGITKLKTYIGGTEVTDEVTDDDPYEVTGCISNIPVTTKGLKDDQWIDIPVQALNYDTSDNVNYNFRFIGNCLEINRAGEATMTVSLKGERVSTTFKAVCHEVLATDMKVIVPKTFALSDWDAVPNQYVGLRPFSEGSYSIEFTPANATNRDVTWTAQTPEIAEHFTTHSAGIVPKKAGTAKFTVTNTLNPKLKQDVEITFTYKNPLTRASVDDLTMAPGTEQALNISVSPSNATEQRFDWTYSRNGIVEVTDEIKTSEDGQSYWTTHSIKALHSGTVTVTGTPWDTTGNCKPVVFTVTVTGDSFLTTRNVTVKAEDTVTYTDETGDYTSANLSGLNTSVATVDLEALTSTGSVGWLGSNTSYNESSVDLADCLYTFTKTGDTWSITANNGTVYLYPGNGKDVAAKDRSSGYPNTASVPDGMTISITAGNETGSFYIYSDVNAWNNGKGAYLYFNRSDYRWDRVETIGDNTIYQTNCSLYLYRAAGDGETSSAEIPGYVRVTNVSDLTDGGQYLIAAPGSNGSYYVAYPNTSTDNLYCQIARVGTGTTTSTEITITGVGAGKTSFIAGQTEYIIRVPGPSDSLTAEWPSFRGNDQNNGVTNAKTPRTAGEAELKWAANDGATKDSWGYSLPTSYIMVDGMIITASGDKLSQIDPATGALVQSVTMAGSRGYAYMSPAYGGGMIFVSLEGGKVQAFDAQTLESKWVYTDEKGGQPLSAIVYDDGYLYTGFGNDWTAVPSTERNWVCIPAADKDPASTNEAQEAAWTYSHAGGFYWSGAYAAGDYLVVGGDKTGANENLCVFDKTSGALTDSVAVDGNIRCTISAYGDNAIAFVTQGGSFYTAQISGEGKITLSEPVTIGGQSTSTPVIVNGYAYVGVCASDYSSYYVAQINLNDNTVKTIGTHAYPQSSLLASTGHGDKTYLYFTCNGEPGGVQVLEVSANGTMSLSDLYVPEESKQNYCLASLMCDPQGTLYYSNDSGYLFALGTWSASSCPVTFQTTPADAAVVVKDSNDNPVSAAREGVYDLTAGTYTYTVTSGDKSKSGTLVITADDAANHTPQTVTVSLSSSQSGGGSSSSGSEGTITVSIRVADPKGETYLEKTSYTLSSGSTVYDLLVETGLSIKSTNSSFGVYIQSIEGLGELDEGQYSGWMYRVNGQFPEVSASAYTLSSGDYVEWVYTRDLGNDVGGGSGGGATASPADQAAADKVAELIAAIGTVTDASGDKIAAARTGYDALTAAQKKLVSNYAVLTAAEQAYGQLTGAEGLPFTDVDGHWALDAIRFVYDQGLMTGTKETQFSPKKPLNRAMLATILYRMEGSPAVTGENPYTDVAAGTWYTDAVLWASEQGIVNGYGNGKFGPLNNITREQLAAMLLRYSDYKKYNTDARNDLASYADADDISAWALEALRWANAQGLVTGRTETTLVPQGDTTRAETATILMRYLDTIAG